MGQQLKYLLHTHEDVSADCVGTHLSCEVWGGNDRRVPLARPHTETPPPLPPPPHTQAKEKHITLLDFKFQQAPISLTGVGH